MKIFTEKLLGKESNFKLYFNWAKNEFYFVQIKQIFHTLLFDCNWNIVPKLEQKRARNAKQFKGKKLEKANLPVTSHLKGLLIKYIDWLFRQYHIYFVYNGT